MFVSQHVLFKYCRLKTTKSNLCSFCSNYLPDYVRLQRSLQGERKDSNSCPPGYE